KRGFKEIIEYFGNIDFEVLEASMPSVTLPNEKFNVCFLSPPSYTSENYGDDIGQSTVLFPERNDWVFSFLFPTINKCWNLLEYEGILIVQSILIEEIYYYIKSILPECYYLGVLS